MNESSIGATTILTLLMLCMVAVSGCSQKTSDSAGIAVESQAAPLGNSWDSIKQLPDWSGVWVLYHGQEAGIDATDPTRTHLTPKYAAIQAAAREKKSQANMSTCLPAGSTGVLQHGLLHEYLFTPGRVTMLFEDGEVRRIYTDGRPHLSLDELSFSFMGDSIGHWQGKTLVVDTIGFPNGELWQNYGVRATKNTQLIERIFLNDQNFIQIDSSLTDPEIFTEPYTYSRQYQRSTLPLTEPICAQNNRDTGSDIDLTPPPEE
jgi:hypothetical protein